MNTKKTVPKFILICVAVLIGLVVFIAGIGLFKKEKPYEPVTIYVGIAVPEMDLDYLINNSSLIVIGMADKIYPGRWTTPNGKQPNDGEFSEFTIVTDTNFQVAQVLKGDLNDANIRIRKFGGQAGQDSVIISAEEIYELDQSYLLFLLEDIGRTSDIEPGHYIAKGGAQGVYKINKDRVIPLFESLDQEWNLDELIAYIEVSLQ